jgi:hypothetical protein
MVPRLSLLPIHADAGIAHRQGVGFLVRGDTDFRCLAVADQFGPGDRFIAELVAGVGRVRNQLAEEDVGLGIDRMHHQVQKLGDLGLERF